MLVSLDSIATATPTAGGKQPGTGDEEKPRGRIEEIEPNHLPKELHDRVREVLRMESHILNCKLCTINATDHAIELQKGTKPVH